MIYRRGSERGIEMGQVRQTESSRLWKVGTRRGMVYAEGRDLAERILSLSGQANTTEIVGKSRKPPVETILPGTMAVYTDRKGKPFAWQIAFDLQHWDSVCAMVGVTPT
jgi:hypothetical protein